MPSASFSFSFDVGSNPACWGGSPSYFELKLQKPLPYYALEQLRARFLYALTSNHDNIKSGRVLFQMAFETEIGTAIAKMVSLTSDIATTNVCERRSYLDIDTNMKQFSFLLQPALQDVLNNSVLPGSYVRLFQTHLQSPYPKYRMCAIAALLAVSAQLLIPDQNRAIVLSFSDAVSAAENHVDTPGKVVTVHDSATASSIFAQRTHWVSESLSTTEGFFAAKGSAGSHDEATFAVDGVTVTFTEGTFWRDQARPSSVITDPDFRFPVGIAGVSDSEIYVIGGITTAVKGWKWDGSSWSVMAGLTGTGGRTIWASRNGSTVYALRDGGPVVSTDHGASWSAVNWPYTYTDDGFTAYEDPLGNITLYCSINQGGCAKSTDGGTTWTLIFGQNPVTAAFISRIYAYDDKHVWIGGGYASGAMLYFYDGTTATRITNIVSLMSGTGHVYSLWSPSPNEVWLGGATTGGVPLDPGIMLHTTDAFATTPSVVTLPTMASSGQNFVNAILGFDANTIYATVQDNNRPQVVKYVSGTWTDDHAVQNAAQNSVALWANAQTGRGVMITSTGKIQVNKSVSAGVRITFNFSDSVTAADARTHTP